MTTKYGLLINIITYETNELETINFIFDSLDECKNKVILTFKNQLEKYNFDFQNLFEDYISQYKFKYDNTIYNLLVEYYIFYNNEWIQPWTIQEIYEISVDLINKLDIQKYILDKYEKDDYDEQNDD
jgi:hypothetical protein